MRIIFMGTPDFAVTCLEELVKANHEIISVYTQPDKPKGRGHKMLPSPVKEFAVKNGITVFTPQSLKDEELIKEIEDTKADIIVVAAYGKILPKRILEAAKLGCVNVHASLLPKYRGAAPIQWSVINGDRETGVTIMQMNEGLDTGDIIECEKVDISDEDNSGTMFDKLADTGSKLLIKVLNEIESGKAVKTPQDDSLSTYAPMLNKEMAIIDWNKSSEEIRNLIRGLYPFYISKTSYGDVVLKIHNIKSTSGIGKPGEVLESGKRLIVACGNNTAAEVLTVQSENGKTMSAADYLRGHAIQKGTVFK